MRAMVAACLLTATLALSGAPAQAAPGMVAAGDPRATQAGMDVLRDGGTAIDAAIAAQMVLAVVEPQRSGLGGGGFLLAYDATTRHVLGWDGREAAPAAAAADLFAREQTLHDPAAARRGGRPVAVPGLPLLLQTAYDSGGYLAWARLLAPAIRLAAGGFVVSPALARDVAARRAALALAGDSHFLPGDAPVAAGATLRNPALAATLRALAQGGAGALYRGAIAAGIATAVRADADPGLLTVDDLAAYRVRPRIAVCGAARGLTVCGMGPPSDGGIGALQILGLLSRFDLARLDPKAAASVVAQAERLAAGDRERYVADPDSARVPTERLIAPTYLRIRAQSLDPRLPQPPAAAGRSVAAICVVDAAGNAVALTSSLGDPFGSKLMAGGMPLNDQLASFPLRPARAADRLAAGKRPSSAMAPTLVFGPDERLRAVMAAASPGPIAQAVLGVEIAGVTRLDVAPAAAAGAARP